MEINRNALPIVEDMISWSDELGIEVEEVGNTIVLDCSGGGYDAGAFFAEVCMGGLGTVGFTEYEIDGVQFPAVQVHTDFPVLACFDCQKADWQIGDSIGSGPARCLNKNENRTSYDFDEEYAIIALETSKKPSKKEIEEISDECGVDEQNIFVLYAPTNSLVGSIQISARVIETAIHKLNRLGYFINEIKNGFGTAPIAPVSESIQKALGKTNDAIIYGGTVNLHVEELSDEFASLVSYNSEGYGKLMEQLYEEANHDFYKIDDEFFAPAEAVINSIKTGKIKHYGNKNYKMLKKSFKMEV